MIAWSGYVELLSIRKARGFVRVTCGSLPVNEDDIHQPICPRWPYVRVYIFASYRVLWVSAYKTKTVLLVDWDIWVAVAEVSNIEGVLERSSSQLQDSRGFNPSPAPVVQIRPCEPPFLLTCDCADIRGRDRAKTLLFL